MVRTAEAGGSCEGKGVDYGSFGYLIAPLDFVPDITPVLGYSDDLVAITFALLKVQGYIDEEVDVRAKELLAKVFDKDVVAKL